MPTTTIASQLTVWKATMVAAGFADSTIKSYLDHVEKYAAFLGGTPDIMDISHVSIGAYKRHYGASHEPRTTGLALTSIRSFCKLLIDLELRLDDPTARIEFPKLSKPLPRALDPELLHELLFVLDHMPDNLEADDIFYWQRNRLAILLMIYAGLRLGEMARLRCGDISLRRRTVTVREGKGSKDRVIPLHPKLIAELQVIVGRPLGHAVCGKYRGGRVLGVKSWHHVFERWVPERLKLSFAFTAHQLRHSFGTETIVHGANVFEVQTLMGHEDPKTTSQYYKAAAEHLRDAVERLPMSW